MSKTKILLGQKGESRACQYLQDCGWEILTRNYRSPYGEIDIIAADQETLVFVEVRSRSGYQQEAALISIDSRKQQKVRQTALYYLQQNQIEDCPLRFDAVAISFKGSESKLYHLKNAF